MLQSLWPGGNTYVGIEWSCGHRPRDNQIYLNESLSSRSLCMSCLWRRLDANQLSGWTFPISSRQWNSYATISEIPLSIITSSLNMSTIFVPNPTTSYNFSVTLYSCNLDTVPPSSRKGLTVQKQQRMIIKKNFNCIFWDVHEIMTFSPQQVSGLQYWYWLGKKLVEYITFERTLVQMQLEMVSGVIH